MKHNKMSQKHTRFTKTHKSKLLLQQYTTESLIVKAGLLYCIALCVALIDQLIKLHIHSYDGSFLGISITHTTNTGVAFGLFESHSSIITAIALLFLLSTIAIIPKMSLKSIPWFGLFVGGALGNVIDRIQVGFVIDYLNVWGLFICNFADICISICAGYFIYKEFTRISSKKQN
jgi:signal peptidase II